MSRKARRAVARKRRAEKGGSRLAPPQVDRGTRTDDTFVTLLKDVTQEILAVTYWFDPVPQPEPYSVTVRFSGRRLNAKGHLSLSDQFVQDETIEQVVPGSGPISLTTKIYGINPGEWAVTACLQKSAHPAHRQQGQENATSEPNGPVVRFWRRWAPPVEEANHLRTCLIPFAHVPGILPGIWGAMVVLGMIVALVLQLLVISADHLTLGLWWVVPLGAILVGIVGAKLWYVISYWHEHRINGWCIQGFVTGACLSAALLLVGFRVPVGAFLDMMTPGLLLAMAVGRIGCFFAGCCGGPPTASRFGVWSSDQRVGAHRVPTQLLELGLAGFLGVLILIAVLRHGTAGGAFFAAGLSAYTLVRQGILHLRAEPRKTKLGGPIIAALAALVLVAAIVWLVR
jgi:phosphatidylglycerol---prolipoprotein diacylglyceryl transferase